MLHLWFFRHKKRLRSLEHLQGRETVFLKLYFRHIFFFINRYVTSATVKSSWGHPGESVTNLDISYLVVFTLQIVCDAILVWGAMKKIPNHLVPWLWANAVIIAVFLVSIFAVSKKLCLEFVLWLKLLRLILTKGNKLEGRPKVQLGPDNNVEFLKHFMNILLKKLEYRDSF